MKVEAGDRVIEVTHADRPVFPAAGLSKGDLVAYYARVAPFALPHIEGRPLTLQRFPQGIEGPGFLTKERPRHFPDWVGAAVVPSSDVTRRRRGGELVMTVVTDAASLVYVVNQGCLTPHVWLSKADRPLHPDRLVFDLDPGEAGFPSAVEAALALRRMLTDDGLTPYVKTTGSRGLHVEVPLDRGADQPAVRAYADAVASRLAEDQPDDFTTEFRKAARRGRLYLDVARNGQAQTVVAAYGVRPLPEAPVATPLQWDEVSPSLDPRNWTVANLFRRLGRRADPWAEMPAAAKPLPTA